MQHGCSKSKGPNRLVKPTAIILFCKRKQWNSKKAFFTIGYFLWHFLKKVKVVSLSIHIRCYSSLALLAELRSRRTETKQHWSKKKKKTNLNLSFECVQIYWMSLRSKINKCMHRKTEKVHRCLLKRRPGSTSEISSAAFSVRWEQQWRCTGSSLLKTL